MAGFKLLGDVAVKKGVSYFFDLLFPKSNDDAFKKIVIKSLERIDLTTRGELFGGRLVEVLSADNIIPIFKRLLIPFEAPTEADLEEYVDFQSLPSGFLDSLKTAIMWDMQESPEHLRSLIDVFHIIQQDNVSIQVGHVRAQSTELLNGIAKIIECLDKLNAAHTNEKAPEKKNYTAVPNYIPRKLQSFDEVSKDNFLPELVSGNGKVIVLSAAGFGKSTELENLAYCLSLELDSFPVLIPLNTYTDQDIPKLLDEEIERWQVISDGRLVAIFDGLDEIHTNYFDSFLSKIIAFVPKYPKLRMVITCRDNFINPGFTTLRNSGFLIFRLQSLSWPDCVDYVRKKLSDEKAEKFINSVHDLNLVEIVKSPFFLTFLIQVYDTEGVLPLSKPDLFEKMIDHRIEKDKVRFARKGINLDKKIGHIKNQIGRLALTLETLGRNYISEEEFETIIPNYEGERELIEHTFLFDNVKEKTWQFEHTNFQEYLAAKVLAAMSLEKAKQLMALPPDYEIVRPRWVNTLSFLFILSYQNESKFNALLDWLMSAGKELLLRFEKNRVGIEVREKIFTAIVEEYRAKGIFTRSENFTLEDLADYVSDSKTILKNLLEGLQKTDSSIVLGETCKMLPRFQHLELFTNDFQLALENIIRDKGKSHPDKYSAYRTLADLKWVRKEFFLEILPSLKFNDQYERAGVFRYLAESGFQNDFVDEVLKVARFDKGVSVMRGRGSRSKVSLYNDNNNRDRYLLSVSSPEGVSKILKFLLARAKKYSVESAVHNLLRDGILGNAKNLITTDNDSILDNVIDLFTALTKYRQKDEGSLFIEFFDSSGTRHKAVERILDKAKTDADVLSSLAILADGWLIDHLISAYSQGKFGDDQVVRMRNSLAWVGLKDLHDRFYAKINELSGSKFRYQNEGIDYEALRRKRLQMDLDLLSDKNEFLSRICSIFDEIGNDPISEDDLWESRKEFLHDENHFDNNLAIDTLRRHEHKPIQLLEFLTTFDKDETWEWFKIHNLLVYDTQGTNTLGEREIAYVKQWCGDQIVKSDFAKAIGKDVYYFRELYIAYWTKRFDISWSDDQYLDFLWVDSTLLPLKTTHNNRSKDEHEIKFGDWIVEKVGLQKVRGRLIENFTAGISNTSVFSHHVALCNRQGIKEALPFIEAFIVSLGADGYDLLDVCQNFLELGGNTTVCDQILLSDRLEKMDRYHLIDMLIKHSSQAIVGFLENQLLEPDEEAALQAASKLMKLGNIKGLVYYKDWVFRHKTFDDFIGGRDFGLLPKKEALPILVELLGIYLSPDFDRDSLTNQDQELLDCLCKVGAENETTYNEVKKVLEDGIAKGNANFLHYHLKRLDQLYFTNLTISASMNEIVEQVDQLLK